MKVIKAYKCRIYPDEEQERLIRNNINCCRWVYNHFLAISFDEYKKTGEISKKNDYLLDLTKLKNDGNHDWLKTADSQALQHEIKHLDENYKHFYRRLKAKKDGKKIKVGLPKFKNKRSKTSYTTNASYVHFVGGSHIKLPAIKKPVKIAIDKPIEGHLLALGISISRSGKFYVSLTYNEMEVEEFPKTGKYIGIDLGVKHFITTSDGEKINILDKFKKNDKIIRRQHKKLSRKKMWKNKETGEYEFSKNYEKQRKKLARAYEHTTNKRVDLEHKISHDLVKNYDIICVEDLPISSLIRNHNLAKQILDSSWYRFTTFLEYKCQWYGKEFVKMDRFFPSSKLCSKCGYKLEKLNLNTRKWKCPECGSEHDRDINASINILNQGLRLLNIA